MKLIFSILSVFMFVSIISGCNEQTFDFIEDLNEPPQISLTTSNSDGGALLQDSIKTLIGLKDELNFYEVRLTVSDANDNLESIEYFQLQGIGVLIQGEDTIIDRNISLIDDELIFRYYPTVYGSHVFRLVATDVFGSTNSVVVELTAFENLSPIGVLNVERDGSFGRLHYEFDGSESYDRDSKYGGELTLYEFSLLDKRFAITHPMLEYVFPEAGVYEVGLRCRDNNGQWSVIVTRTITIDE